MATTPTLTGAWASSSSSVSHLPSRIDKRTLVIIESTRIEHFRKPVASQSNQCLEMSMVRLPRTAHGTYRMRIREETRSLTSSISLATYLTKVSLEARLLPAPNAPFATTISSWFRRWHRTIPTTQLTWMKVMISQCHTIKTARSTIETVSPKGSKPRWPIPISTCRGCTNRMKSSPRSHLSCMPEPKDLTQNRIMSQDRWVLINRSIRDREKLTSAGN